MQPLSEGVDEREIRVVREKESGKKRFFEKIVKRKGQKEKQVEKVLVNAARLIRHLKI